jgi:CBS domain containing-hemolysin-like protein
MFTFLVIVTVLVFLLLISIASVQVESSRSSHYELRRRAKIGDAQAETALSREELLGTCRSLLRTMEALLLVVFVVSAIGAFGWLIGVVVAVVGALWYGAIAQVHLVHQFMQPQYDRLEPRLLAAIQRYPLLSKLLRGVPSNPYAEAHLESREELLHLLDSSPGIMTTDQKKLIKNGLGFDRAIVEDYMTPRSMIDSIPKDEVLGPLALDTLHKTGHSRFPVIDGDIDHVVGMVYIHNLLSLRDKSSRRACDLMEVPVYYIHYQQNLQHALAAFLRTHHHLFIVVNEYHETVGLLTLEDTIEALLGRKIIDEFDTHEDLRAVAARNPHKNNLSSDAKTV